MTAVEWLAEKYNYITWMRNRDEMSPETADKLRQAYLEQAKQMEKEQNIDMYNTGYEDAKCNHINDAEQYYNQKYKQLL
jgi:hypothetical protein